MFRGLLTPGDDRVRSCETPDFLLDHVGDREIPYVEADSVWAETGYGQFRDDLVERVLRGDRRP